MIREFVALSSGERGVSGRRPQRMQLINYEHSSASFYESGTVHYFRLVITMMLARSGEHGVSGRRHPDTEASNGKRAKAFSRKIVPKDIL